MSSIAIQTVGLGKQYRIGVTKEKYSTLRDTLTNPFKSLRKSVPRKKSNEDDASVFWALKDINFEVERGDVLGIVGHNGAGKSTLLKVLSRITEPTLGHIDIHGRVASLLEVGTGFHPELSGRENIFLNGAILGMHRHEITSKFDEIVAFAEVEKFIDTPVKHYSSGMYLRLAFAVAAHLEPEILVVDEVLAVGDMAFQKKCMGKMQDVAGQGRTVLFVSHNTSAVLTLCNKALLLERGQIVANGASKEVITRYLQGANGNTAEAQWSLEEAPGRNGFKYGYIGILDENGKPANVLNVERPACVRVRYHLSVPDMSFRVSLRFNSEGAIAFTTLEPIEAIHEKEGWYVSEVAIPAHLFAENDYTVSVVAFFSRGKKVHIAELHDVVGFQAYDLKEGTSARGDYVQQFPGVLRPKLDWEMNYLGETI